MSVALFLLALSAPASAAAATPGTAVVQQAADVNHCVRDDGVLVYTDKSCAAVRARPLGEDDAARGPFMPAYRSGCIRSLREFAYELSSAIEVGDVNRLAALYRWHGTTTHDGYATMARLQEIVARPLLQVEPVYPQPVPSPAPSTGLSAEVLDPAILPPATSAEPLVTGPLATEPSATGPQATGLPGIDPPQFDPYADAAPRRGPPVALRLDQTLANGVTPAPTTLRLQRELGCWWVSL